MLKEKVLKKIFIGSLIVSLIGVIAFSIVAYWNYSYLVGWTMGSFVTISAFLLRDLITRHFFKKRHSKRAIIWIVMFQNFAFFLYFIVWLITLIMIDFAVHGIMPFREYFDSSVVFSPINLFTFIAGWHVIIVAILVTNSWKIKKVTPEERAHATV